jgi:hypothetical protein
MAFEIIGKVIDIAPVIQVSDKFRKREFVIEKKENGANNLFIDYIKFQLTQDRCDLINESFMNEEVRITFNVKGNKWERDGKVNYFTNLDAWKVEKLQAQQQSPAPDHFSSQTPVNNDFSQDVSELDDLPF